LENKKWRLLINIAIFGGIFCKLVSLEISFKSNIGIIKLGYLHLEFNDLKYNLSMTIGVYLEATNIRVGIVEGDLVFNQKVEPFPFDKSESETIDYLIDMIEEMMNTNIKGIGIGVPSVVDSKRGIVYNATNIPSWEEVYLKNILEAHFSIPVHVNNDCNCFAFGERYYGEGTPYHNIVAVTLGTGVGAGIIINDVLYEGLNTGAGEIGSLPYLDHDYEYYCANSFFKLYDTTFDKSYAAALDGDFAALKIWILFGAHVGNLMKAILLTYDPEAIIIGGEIAKAYPFFKSSMNENLDSFRYRETLKKIKILISKREDVGLLGAAALVS
jgi:glucokinase